LIVSLIFFVINGSTTGSKWSTTDLN
jgi:hypothetical protein